LLTATQALLLSCSTDHHDNNVDYTVANKAKLLHTSNSQWAVDNA
jgi:hypothetical protein